MEGNKQTDGIEIVDIEELVTGYLKAREKNNVAQLAVET